MLKVICSFFIFLPLYSPHILICKYYTFLNREKPVNHSQSQNERENLGGQTISLSLISQAISIPKGEINLIVCHFIERGTNYWGIFSWPLRKVRWMEDEFIFLINKVEGLFFTYSLRTSKVFLLFLVQS